MTLFPPGLPLAHGPQWTDRLATWCARRIPHVGLDGDGRHLFGECWAVGVMRGGRLAAAVVFSDYHPGYGTVQLSCAAARPGLARWAMPDVLGAILGAAFEGKLGAPVRKVWTATPSTAKGVVKFNAHVGFKQEAVLREHYAPKVHAVICSMMAYEWKRRYGVREDASKPSAS